MRIITILVLVTTFSYAQEVESDYEFLGFSDDLKYAAFETHTPPAVDDDVADSKIIIVDIATNNWATKPLKLVGKKDQSTEDVVKANKAAAQSLFTKYKITPGKNPGQKIPLKMEKDNFNRDVPEDVQVFVIDGVKYTLELKTIDTDEIHPALEIPKRMFDLSVRYANNIQALQKDKSVPASRGFAIGYRLLSAYHSGQRLVVFMEYHNPGFEGVPDRHDMVVTGVLGR